VGQEPVLFNTSIKENMLFAKPDATDEEIIDALKAANAWDFIKEKMSDKLLDTQVGAAGGQLSGGQK
jgi:ABC-type multidrug transport system fused ATPase/permease subunit